MRVVIITKLVLNIAVTAAVFALVMFLPAGTLRWPAAWIYLLLMFGFTVALSIWLMKFNPDLLAERLSGIGKPDQKSWDKVFLAVLATAFLGWFAFMALDAVRFSWSNVPGWGRWIGVLLLLASFYIFYLVFRENSYLSPAVRVQTERGQTVVSTGPYAYIRHPMYAGFMLFAIGTTLLLGSAYGLIGAALLIVMVAWRAVQEEHVLERELKGYAEYQKRVRYRFVPYMW